ncbi:MAG TPA: RNA polymerase sigma factor [Saprospiraceae bacterium]|nr:RNA polymerase sigma factor [Saprospiraceae bacterium]
MTKNTEIQRVIEAKNGNSESLALLFQQYYPQLYTHALRLVGNPMAQDVIQDTYISAHTHMSSLRDITLFYPWLKKILINNCYLILRKEKSLFHSLTNASKDAFIDESIEQHLENLEDSQQIFDTLSNLSSELRSCVLLRYFSSFIKYEEIAMILDIPIGTVRSRLAAAREKLISLYSHYSDSSDKVWIESKQWAAYYHDIWKSFYDDPEARREFINHFNLNLQLRFTSSKLAVGRKLLEAEFNDDLKYGSRFNLKEVNTCGNISILEGFNTNSIEYPDRCAHSTIIVLFREDQKSVKTCHVYDSPRII